ncbi:hypothetical protein FAI40_07915 [Acetobacteraceae bacterium]|nr:hypothetical protein FAI40_07915 [Acetobacteraceae bacterium]
MLFLVCGVWAGNALGAAPKVASPPKDLDDPIPAAEAKMPAEELEFLSLGEYWGVRTDMDAAEGGNGERKVIDSAYNWDDEVSAKREEEAFNETEKSKKAPSQDH